MYFAPDANTTARRMNHFQRTRRIAHLDRNEPAAPIRYLQPPVDIPRLFRPAVSALEPLSPSVK
jgi:hypothetical protein